MRDAFLMWGELLIQLVLPTKLHLLHIWKISFSIPLFLCPALRLHWSQISEVTWGLMVLNQPNQTPQQLPTTEVVVREYLP